MVTQLKLDVHIVFQEPFPSNGPEQANVKPFSSLGERGIADQIHTVDDPPGQVKLSFIRLFGAVEPVGDMSSLGWSSKYSNHDDAFHPNHCQQFSCHAFRFEHADTLDWNLHSLAYRADSMYLVFHVIEWSYRGCFSIS